MPHNNNMISHVKDILKLGKMLFLLDFQVPIGRG